MEFKIELEGIFIKTIKVYANSEKDAVNQIFEKFNSAYEGHEKGVRLHSVQVTEIVDD